MLNEIFAVKDHAWEHKVKVKEVIGNFLSRQQNGLYTVQIKRVTNKRTGNQNNLLWMLLDILAPEIGYQNPEAVLSIIMKRLNLGTWKEFAGVKEFDRDSSAIKDTITFGKILDECYVLESILNEDREPHEHMILPRVENERQNQSN